MNKLKEQFSQNVAKINRLPLSIQLLISGLIILVFGLIVSITIISNAMSSWFLLGAILALGLSLILVQFGYTRSAAFIISLFVFTTVFLHSIWEYNSVNNATHAAMVLVYAFWLVLFSEREANIILALIVAYLIGFYLADNQGMFGEPSSTASDLFDIVVVVVLFAFSFYFAIRAGNQAHWSRAKELENEYKRLFDNLPIGLYRTTVDGVQLRANRTMYELEGYGSEEESVADVIDIGNDWYVEPGRREEFVQEIQENGKIVNFESEINLPRLNKQLWVSETAYPVYDENGKILFFEGSVQDISQRKTAEADLLAYSAELKKISTELQNITDSARDSIVRADSDGIIEFANPATEQIFGYSPDELIGQSVEVLIKEELRPAFWKRIKRDIRGFRVGRNVHMVEVNGFKKCGEPLIVEMSLSILINGDGQLSYLGIIRDITEKKKMAGFLNHMQRLDSLGLLAGGIAHDFNNLLVAIIGQTSLAIRKLPAESPIEPHLQKSLGASQQAAELCRQLLAYSGKGHLQIENIALNELVKENLQLHQIAIPGSVELKTTLDPTTPEFLGDPAQIQQVILNLLLNAVDAIGIEGGKISLQTEARTIAPQDSLVWTLSGRALNPGKYAAMHVTDNGSGISKETLDRIFEPFFTTKPEGYGLGLAGVQGIVRGHNGGILVHSIEQKGTTFSIYFPAAVGSQAQEIEVTQ